ncbi:MAG: ABC transporter substrate-binding protein [Bacteroidota bacterium]
MNRKIILLHVMIFIPVFMGFFLKNTSAAPCIKVLQPEYTKGFIIEYYQGGIKRIQDNDGRRFWLIPRGQKSPQELSGQPLIPIPLKRALFASVNQVCLLRPFGDDQVWSSVSGVATPSGQWYIPSIKSGLANGSITYIGDAYSPDYEKICLLQPEVAFIYTGGSGLTDMAGKLEELKIPYFAENSYLETDPLGRMEWVKFYAAFYNREALAIRYFDAAVGRIEKLKGRIPKANRPKVSWGVIYNGKVYIPGGRSFVARMIEMAGGEFIFKTLSAKEGSIGITLEDFFVYSKAADVMIYASFPQYAPSISAITRMAPVLAGVKPIQTEKVWVLQPWYNQQQDRTDQVLADLAAIFYPEEFPGYKLKNFQRLPVN